MMITVEFARTLYADDDPVHDFDHVLRVLALAQHIGEKESADLAIIEAAVLLHDIDRLEGDSETGLDTTDHALIAAARARHILSSSATPAAPEFIDAVAHAIEAHRFRNDIDPVTLEAKVVFDADKLDAIGAIGIARAYAYGAREGKKLWADVLSDYSGDDPDHTPVHEYVYKLSRIQTRMQTATGQALARQRHDFMVAFFEQLAYEVHGKR